MTKPLVALTAVIIFITIMAWDVYLYIDSIPDNSITQTVIHYSQYPLFSASLGFAFGFLFAHLFDTTSQKKK